MLVPLVRVECSVPAAGNLAAEQRECRPGRSSTPAAGPMLTAMVSFPALLWLTMAAIGAACVVAFLHYLAVALENERRVETLKAECAELRTRFARQLQQAAARADIIEVSPIEDEPLLRAA